MIHASGARLPFHSPSRSESLPDNFAIYTFPLAENIKNDELEPWRLQRICTDAGQALQEARQLYNTRRFARIEVRRRYTDDGTGILRDEPIQVLDVKKNKPLESVAAILITAALCVCIAAGLVLLR